MHFFTPTRPRPEGMRDISARLCGRRLSGNKLCARDATLHFLMRAAYSASGYVSMSTCWWHQRACRSMSMDEHPVGPSCGHPRALWALSDGAGPGYCIDPIDKKLARHAARELVSS